MTDHCCQCHEHQMVFVANISLDELAEKKKKTLSKLNNTSGRHCSLWFFQTSLKKFLEKTPLNQKKTTHRLPSLSLLVDSSTADKWHSPILQLKDTSFQVSTPHTSDLAFDETTTNKFLGFSPAEPHFDSALKVTQRQSNLQQNISISSELPCLGVSLDDSRFSWTSSLATPSVYTAEDALAVEDETELEEQMTKPKILARALFSPDKEQSNLDDVHQLSTNKSNIFKSCDKKPSAVDTQVSYPNIPFSPVLFDSKDSCAILLKHEAEQCHGNRHSISFSTSLSSGDFHATVNNSKLTEEEMGCGSVETPVSRLRTDSQLHSILTKKKHFSSTPKHVHFSESSPLLSDCDKNPKNFKSADKLRQLRDSSEIPTDITHLTIQSQCLEDSSTLKMITVDKNLDNVESRETNWKKDSLQVAESQSDKDSSPISLTSKNPHSDDKPNGESIMNTTLAKTCPAAHPSHLKPKCKTTPRSPPCSNHKSFFHSSPISNSDIKLISSDSSDAVSSAVTKKGLNYPFRSCTSSGYMSVVSATNENHNLQSPDFEGLLSMGSHSNKQGGEITGNSPQHTSGNISNDSLSFKDAKELLKVSPEKLNSHDSIVSPPNKDDKNPIVFTQFSFSHNEKLISKVDQMSNRDILEMSTIEPLQIELCSQIEDNISERREFDPDCSTLIIDDETKLYTHDQKGTSDQCSAVTPINNPPSKNPTSSQKTVSQSKTCLNNSDATTFSSSSTPKVVSLCGKLRRKSKNFLYPTASQINLTSPLMAFNFKVQSTNDEPDYITKCTVDPLNAIDSDRISYTRKNNQKNNLRNSTEHDLESNTRTLSSKNTVCHYTTDKQHEMASPDQLSNKGNSPRCSQPDKAVNSSTNSILVESADKMSNDTKDATCEKQQEIETMSHCKYSGDEFVHSSTISQCLPFFENAIICSNHHLPMNVCQIDCQGTEIHQKTKFYGFQSKQKIPDSEVSEVRLLETSTVPPLNSESNSGIEKQHTFSASKIPGISEKTECNLVISKSPDKELALIPNCKLNQNLQEAHNIRESMTVQNNQMSELLTASQMVKWEELDNLSEAFIEKDNCSTLNILHSSNDQVCCSDTETQQGNSKMQPKEKSSCLAGEDKIKEKEIQNYQSTDITSQTGQTITVSYECLQQLTNENGNESKDSPVKILLTPTKGEKENIEYLGMELDDDNFYIDSVSVHFDSPEFHFSEIGKANNQTEDKNGEFESLVNDYQIESFVDKMDWKLSNQTNSLHTSYQIGSTAPRTDKEKSVETEKKKKRNINSNFSNEESQTSNLKINQNLTIKKNTGNLKKSKKLLKGFRPFKAPRRTSDYLANTKSPQQEYMENEKIENQNEKRMLKYLNGNSENEEKELQKILNKGRKQISEKEESLKKAQNLLSDETIEAQSLGGFSTAKGKQISVKEESLKKAQNLLSDETIEVPSLGGFSTAKGKQISVKEESLKKAQNLLSDETIEVPSLGGFSTAKGKQISVKEESLKKAQNLLSDETIEAQSLEGFSTAKGKQISVKEESLKKAQKLLSDETIEVPSLGGFSTAKGKQISVKEESLKKAQNLLSDETIEVPSLGGFSTAKGKQISVKEESLKKAQNLLSDETIEAQSLEGFSTAKGKQISVKEESLKKAQKLLSDETIEVPSLGGFSTAKGKQISVKEESLKKAQNLLSDETIEVPSLGGFSTAKGKQITVKEESLKKAQNLLSDETIEAQSLGGFSTAKGKQISVKEESLKKAQKLLSDETIEAQSLGGFSTAKGKQISVKEESLKKAQNLLSDETIEAQSLGGFSTAKGKQISVKEESLKKAQKLLSDETIEVPSLGGFSTAKGKQISVKEESLKKAQNLLSDETIEVPSLGGFSTAKGKQISVKEESLKKAQNLLSDETIEAQSLGAFSTAKGKQISVKEESLKKSVDAMDEAVFNDFLSVDFISSQMNGDSSFLNPAPIESDLTSKDDLFPMSTLATKTEITNNNDHFIEDIFNCSWDDDISILSNIMKRSSSFHPNTLKRSVSEMSSRESDSHKKRLKIDEAENDCSLLVYPLLSKNNSELDKPCQLTLNADLGKFSKSQDISDEVLIQTVKIYENQPGVDSKIVSEDLKTESGCDSKDQYLNDSDCSNESEMALAVEKLEGEWKCSKIFATNQMTDHKISNLLGDKASCQERDSATSKICSGFQTCLGQKVLVSNESLQKAVKMLNSSSESSNEDVQDKMCTALPTGLSKKVYVSEKAQETMKTFNKQTHEENPVPDEMKLQTFIAFQTALGKDVTVSKKSINKARQVLDEGNPIEKDPSYLKAKYPRKETPNLIPDLCHNKPEERLYADPQLNNNRNSVPSAFLSLQHETNKINLLNQKQTSISWQPSKSNSEEDRSGVFPLLTDPVEILSDQNFASRQHSFCDLISQNPMDQSIPENTVEKMGQDISSKKVDFKTPYRKTPAISEVQKTVKVFPRISRPVFRGYRTLPNSLQEDSQKYLNSNLMSSTICGNLTDEKRQSNRLKDKECCQKNEISQEPFPCSTDSFSSYIAVPSCSDDSTKSADRHQNTNLLSTKSSFEESTLLSKSSDGKQFDKETSKTKNTLFLEKPKLGLVPDDQNADGLSKKHLIPEIKDNPANQIQITNQKEMKVISLNATHFVSLKDNSSDKEKSSRNQENIDQNFEFNKQSEVSFIESTENLCSKDLHFDESHLEQDMIVIRKKRKKILPHAGILTCQKASRKRMKFSDLLLEDICISSFLPEQFFAYGIHPNTLTITSANAIDYRFQLSSFYNIKCLHRLIIGDGAILVPDAKFTAGKEEFFRAFQTIEGVDPKLISPEWFFNHYRWIIWKLAAYEVTLPQYFGRRCLSPEMVVLQLKFRYDIEIDKCQRSALRKIIERDDSPAKRMVLCVSQINQALNTSTESPATTQTLTNLEVTDGWYAIKMFLDCHLSSLISKKKLRIGQKLCISNAELIGTDTACSPLDISENVGLKVSGNCCRPACWDAKLGYQADPRPLCLPLIQVAPDGGLVGCVDVIVTRIYPIRFMEKVPGGRSVFRTSREENRQEQRHELLQQEAAEKIYNQLQASFESCFPKQGQKQCKNWNQEEIQRLDNGQDLYEAMTCALQPDNLLDCLSEMQLILLADYKRTIEEHKAQKMKEEFQKAISNEEHASLKRNVTPLMKVRLLGCSHFDQQHKASTILTIWRPSEDLQQLLEEGQRYRIYNVMPSPARSSFLSSLDVHLTVTRSTHFELLKRHSSIPQDLFHPRKVSSAVELQTKSVQEDRLEVDVTGIVLRITKIVSANQRKLELLHAVDVEGKILTLRFWGGLQIFSVNDLLLEEVIFAGLNLLLRPPSPKTGTSTAILDVCSEVSHFSLNPHQDYLRDSINQLHKLKASEEFLAKSHEKLDSLLISEKFSIILPKTPSMSVACADNLIVHESDEARKKQKMLQKSKCAKLLSYGSGPSLSPLSIRVPSTLCKAFKPPSITKLKNT